MARRKRLLGGREVRGSSRYSSGKSRQNGVAAWAGLLDDDPIARGTIRRTERMILAAVRVWELRRGIRN